MRGVFFEEMDVILLYQLNTAFMRILLIFSALLFTFSGFTQNTLSSNASSDPAARAILDKMKAKYEGYKTMDVVFELDIKLADQPVETQNIRFYKKDKAYRVEMPGRTVVSDGSVLWMIQERNKEVQINDVPEASEDTDILSPSALFSLYEREDFAFVLVGAATQAGKVVQFIEFKPLSEDSEYSKLRLTLEKKNQELVSVEAFSKDGSRFTVRAKSLRPNLILAETLFTFQKAKYPDYYVEDLRY